MAPGVTVVSECSLQNCEEPEEDNSQYCIGHLESFFKQGWKRNLRTGAWHKKGVKMTPGGRVTVTASYNPRMVSLMAGDISVEELDDEELARGMCRNPNGGWPQKKPEMVPKVLHDRMVRELFSRADEALRMNLLDAVNSVTKIATGDSVDANVKLKAAQWMFERLRGKVPDVVQVTQEKPFEVTLDKLHRGPRPGSEDEGDVVDAEVVEDGDEPERVTRTRRSADRPRQVR